MMLMESIAENNTCFLIVSFLVLVRKKILIGLFTLIRFCGGKVSYFNLNRQTILNKKQRHMAKTIHIS